MMKKTWLALALMSVSTMAMASTNPVQDTREILAGTVTTAATKKLYTSGAKDNTAAFKGALAAYMAIRSAEKRVPVVVPPKPVPPAPVPTPDPVISDSWMQCASERGTCMVEGKARVRFGNVTNFVEKDITGSLPCTNEEFGRDPTPGFEKTCASNGKVIFPAPTPAPAPPTPAPLPVVVAPPAPPTPLPLDGWVVSTVGIRAGGYVQLTKNCPTFEPSENAGVVGGIYSVVSWGWTPTLSDQVQPPKVQPDAGNFWTIKAGNGGFIYQYQACMTAVTQGAMPG